MAGPTAPFVPVEEVEEETAEVGGGALAAAEPGDATNPAARFFSASSEARNAPIAAHNLLESASEAIICAAGAAI